MPATPLASPFHPSLHQAIEPDRRGHSPSTFPVRLSLKDAAERGYGGYSTLRKKISSGELPAERVGRRYLILESDLEALVAPVVGRPTEHASVSAAIDRIVASAPRLSKEQRERLATLLGGGAA